MANEVRSARESASTKTAGAGVCALLLGAMAMSACGPTNIVLRARPGGPGAMGPLQRCEIHESPCATDPSQDESRFNPTNASFVSLPNCPNGIDRILVQNASTANPVAIVQCAAPDSTPGDGGIPSTDNATP